jgi:hypothetical protein
MLEGYAHPLWIKVISKCDLCGSEESGFPTALILRGNVICLKCLPDTIDEAIRSHYYPKCKEEGCERRTFYLKDYPRHPYCDICSYYMFRNGAKKKKGEIE